MNKIFLILVSLLCLSMPVKAQDVYNEVLAMATNVAEDESQPMQTRLVNVFKVDALKYMLQRTCELFPESSVNELNEQSLALYEFICDYTTVLRNTTKFEDRQEIITRYKNASLKNKRFFDQDKELVEAYLRNDKYLTQFSLDTDWKAALAEVRRSY